MEPFRLCRSGAGTGRLRGDPSHAYSSQRCCRGRHGHLGALHRILKRVAERPASLLVTTTTNSPLLARRLAMAAAAGRKAIRVLLVEDEEIHRVLARATLKAAVGCVVLDEAGNGAEAVRRVREGGAGAYDLILTDRQMPVMDGHEAMRQIRALGVTTPIVGLSSDSLDADVDAFIKAGADHFTPKPLSKEKLNHILAKFNLA
ncbi:unnamed protein product [Urochloa decumbens]|uniref:Response regulatory domain-containing protein n=1 Tax=Urochloa decumbens TaxID=240449 RepID=A0ABC8X3N6_9POAL